MLLILKKNKFLRKKHYKTGKWTYSGFIEATGIISEEEESDNLYFDEIHDHFSTETVDDLQDIRVNPAFFQYAKISSFLKRSQNDN